jgi:hypothetical protein
MGWWMAQGRHGEEGLRSLTHDTSHVKRTYIRGKIFTVVDCTRSQLMVFNFLQPACGLRHQRFMKSTILLLELLTFYGCLQIASSKDLDSIAQKNKKRVCGSNKGR